MDRFETMRLFVRLVERRSFTAAAADLGIPRSTASEVLRGLEAHLGVRLLERTTRHVTPTLDGEEYYRRCVAILAEVEEAESAMRDAQPRGLLRFDAHPLLTRTFILPKLPEFLARHPLIELQIGQGDRLVDLVREGVDCVIRGGKLDDSSLVARPIGQASMVTCATPGYLKQYGVPAYPEELKNGHKLVSYVSTLNGRAVPLRFERDGILSEFKVEHRMGVNESNAHLAAGLAGLGIIQTFAYAAGPALRNGSLVEILQAWRPAPYPFHVVYPQNRHLTHRLRVFIDWLLECFPSRLDGKQP